jgi:RNase H-like domain found in reverse transcriptase/Reverse transcriptase (RNA-dependent DNA polymerase)
MAVVTNGVIETSDGFVNLPVANLSKPERVLPKRFSFAVDSSVEIIRVVEQSSKMNVETWLQEIDLSHLKTEESARVQELLRKYSCLFDGVDLGPIDGLAHHIETRGARPVHQSPYRAGPHERRMIEQEVERMLHLKVIQPSMSAWSSPVVLVPKTDGTIRFCADYRKLNELTVRDSFPLPRLDDTLDSIGDATIFSTLDARAGFWQVPMHQADQEKTAFTSHKGLYEFLKMLFNLRKASSTFQRNIDIILSRVKWKACLVYLNDIIVFSKSFEDHLRDFGETSEILRQANVQLKSSKCNLFQERIVFLGHELSPGRMRMPAEKCRAVDEMRVPKSQSDIRSFLGLCGVYRRYVRDFVATSSPLSNMLNDQPATFEVLPEDAIAAIHELKCLLSSPPVLAFPREGGAKAEFLLQTDASTSQVGFILMQRQIDGQMHQIGFWSRKLHAAGLDYSATEREALAIVWAIQLLRPYLQGYYFDVESDHSACQALLRQVSPNRRLMKWRLQVSDCRFKV